MITPEQLSQFEIAYFTGYYPHQRYGQALDNLYSVDKLWGTNLFYEQSIRKSIEIAWKCVYKFEVDSESK